MTIQHHARTSLVALAAIFAAALGYNVGGLRVHAQTASPALPKIWTGVYASEQADRGKAAFDAYCAKCHNFAAPPGGGGARAGGAGRGGAAGGRGRGGRGGGAPAGGPPLLSGDGFWLDFEGQPLGSLLSKMQRTMPQDAPGSLRDDDYTDLLAYLLAQNTFPAGKANLAAAGLDAMLIVKQSGLPTEAANFGLARVVGCLAAGAKNTWVLTNAVAPTATRDERSTPASVTAAATLPLGSQTFRLIDAGHLDAAAHVGQRVEIRGLLNNAPGDPRIDVLSLEAAGTSCGA